VDLTPSGIQVGLITLQAWQITPVPQLPADFLPNAAFLIRINYDLDIAPDTATPRWFEVAFTFAVPGATVHDALPQRTNRHAPACGYLLNSQLAFARQDQSAATALLSDIEQPPAGHDIQVFGRGSPTARWRHLEAADAPIGSGSYTGWIVLLVPADQRQLRVSAAAQFSLPTPRSDGLRGIAYPDALIMDLPELRAAFAHRENSGGRQVFVSYTHDSPAHKATVNAFCKLLRDGGVNVLVDQDESAVRRDWQEWMTIGIHRSDFVVVVASPAYRSVGLFEFDYKTHAGAQAEYRLLTSLLREDRSTWLRRILPVILPGQDIDEIPVGLQPYDADHYQVRSLTADGMTGLLRTIHHIPDIL
jgi:hypothetical protein